MTAGRSRGRESRLKPRLGSLSLRATGRAVTSRDSQPSRDFSRDIHSPLRRALLLTLLLASPSGRTLLVDSGKNGHGDRLRAVLQLAGVSQIDHFVATHYHEDHYGGIDDLADALAVPIINAYDRGDKAFLPASRLNSATYGDYDAAVGHRALHLTRGETIPGRWGWGSRGRFGGRGWR